MKKVKPGQVRAALAEEKSKLLRNQKIRELEREMEKLTKELDVQRAENATLREEIGAGAKIDTDKLSANMRLFKLHRVVERLLSNMQEQQKSPSRVKIVVGQDNGFDGMSYDDLEKAFPGAESIDLEISDGDLIDVTSFGDNFISHTRGPDKPSSVELTSTIPAKIAVEFINIVQDLETEMGPKQQGDVNE